MKSVRVHVPQRSVSDTTNSNRSGYDVNFCDVFGGPPRRASMHETRHLYSFSDSDEGMQEKPVFGDDSANRRRKGNDFFNDIFGGHESSPRKHHDPFSSSSGNSLPSPFSLPAKVMDLPTFGSHTRCSARSYSYSRSLSQSTLSGQSVQPENAIPSFDRQRSLPRELWLDNDAVMKGLPRKSGSNVVTHKVKEFAKIINHQESSNPKTESITEQKKVEECLKQSDKCDSASKTDNYKSSSTDSVPDVSKTVVGDANESSKRDFLMKEIAIEKNEKVQADKEVHEDMQAVDAQIHKWSNGKEANIRSLLSTLQYVLWAESGWKPVPLVDIIEGNSVKRAYQRALLRLHPDKLQQKGAASHHKYIAEKVFDILQEAWNQYNLLGSF